MLRIFAQVSARLRDESLERPQECSGHAVVRAIVFLLCPHELLPGAIDTGERLLERRRRALPSLNEDAIIKGGRVHLPCAFDEVMSSSNAHGRCTRPPLIMASSLRLGSARLRRSSSRSPVSIAPGSSSCGHSRKTIARTTACPLHSCGRSRDSSRRRALT